MKPTQIDRLDTETVTVTTPAGSFLPVLPVLAQWLAGGWRVAKVDITFSKWTPIKRARK